MKSSIPNKNHALNTKSRKILKQDNFFQRAEVIKRNREKRTRHGQFLVEGVAQITLAVKNGWRVAALLFASDRPLSTWAAELLRSGIAEESWEMAPDLMTQLSDKDETSELLALIYTQKLTPNDLNPRENGLIVIFDRPSSPGNLGSSIRSADAFGAHGIIISGHAVDLYDPFVVRGSMGAVFSVPIATCASHNEVSNWISQARTQGFDYQLIGSSGKCEKFITEQEFKRPTALVLGNETVGMSRGYFDICDAVVKIPIGGALSSLNVSCAASILLYEVVRQRNCSF